MAPIRTAWTRLIRFVAAETSQVHFGQPVDANVDVGKAALSGERIRAHEVVVDSTASASALASATVSDNVLTVQHLLAPLSREQVGLVRCLGLNYADHAEEAKLPKPNAPILFYKPQTSLIGPGAVITVPRFAQPVDKHVPDFEVELTVVIGKPAKNVSEADALDYVLGYTGGNDQSFRFHQMNVSQWGFSKGFDDATPIGPCIVAGHAIPDPQNLSLKTVVNGETMQDGNSSDMIFNVRQTISFLSQGTTLMPGSLIMTGTPKGVGFVRKPAVYLKQGDNVEMWFGNGIGTLANTIVEEGQGSSKL